MKRLTSLMIVAWGCSSSHTSSSVGPEADATVSDANAVAPDVAVDRDAVVPGPDASVVGRDAAIELPDSAVAPDTGAADASNAEPGSQCRSDLDCGGNGDCRATECVFPCRSDAECHPGFVCDPVVFECRRDGAVPGDPCSGTADCPGEAPCNTERMSRTPGGICFFPCETHEMCPSQTECVRNRCLRSCGSSQHCPPARICGPWVDEDPFRTVCVPICISDADCTEPGLSCWRDTWMCIP